MQTFCNAKCRGTIQYLYKEFAETWGTWKDQKHNSLGFNYWQKPQHQTETSGISLDR